MYFYNGLHGLYGFLVYDYFFEKNFLRQVKWTEMRCAK